MPHVSTQATFSIRRLANGLLGERDPSSSPVSSSRALHSGVGSLSAAETGKHFVEGNLACSPR
jgi:hypothetical protein